MKGFSRPLERNTHVGIDVGSANTVCAITSYDPVEGKVKLLGLSSAPSKGIKKGSIIHRDQLVTSIEEAIKEAETMARVNVSSAVLSISGEQVRGINTQGAIAIQKGQSSNVPAQHEITESEVQRVVEMAKAVSLPMDRDILHVLPQQFLIDSMDSIKDPISMSGRRLEARVHLVTVSTTAATNLANCAEELGISVEGLVFHGLASAAGTLDSDEKELGVALVDIGEGTTDVVIYHEGGIHHTAVLGIGAGSITNDVAVMLQVGTEEAEAIKRKYGSAKASMSSPELEFDLPVKNGGVARKISEHELSRYVEARMVEILQLIQREIGRAGLREKLTYGVVLTGGGSGMRNLSGLAEEILNMPVRIGKPKGIHDSVGVADDSMYSAAVGLAVWKFRPEDIQPMRIETTPIKQTVESVKKWFKEFF